MDYGQWLSGNSLVGNTAALIEKESGCPEGILKT